MKEISFLFFLSFLVLFVCGQYSTISLTKKDTVFNPVIRSEAKNDVQQISLTIKLKGEAPKDSASNPIDITVPVVISSLRKSKIAPLLIPGTIKIGKNEWPGKPDSATTVEKTIVVQTSSVKEFGVDEYFYLKLDKDNAPKAITIDDCAECNYEVRVTNNGVYDSNKPFWVEVGANFDLVDGLEPNNFFSGVFFYKRDIRPVFYKSSKKVDNEKSKSKHKSFYDNYQRQNNLAVFAGVFESKTITSQIEEPLDLRRYYDSTSIIAGDTSSLNVYSALGSRISRRTVRNVGLFYSPQVRLTFGSSNSDGFHVFAAFWAELQWQRIQEEKQFNQFKVLDTVKRPIREVLNNDTFLTKDSKKEIDVRSHYLGLGLPIFYKQTISNNIVHLFINPVFGLTSQPTEEYLRENELYQSNAIKYPKPNKRWSPFYLVQFRLNEENYGIAFTGEVRGLLLKDNKPYVSLSLTKKFDLTKFIEFNK